MCHYEHRAKYLSYDLKNLTSIFIIKKSVFDFFLFLEKIRKLHPNSELMSSCPVQQGAIVCFLGLPASVLLCMTVLSIVGCNSGCSTVLCSTNVLFNKIYCLQYYKVYKYIFSAFIPFSP